MSTATISFGPEDGVEAVAGLVGTKVVDKADGLDALFKSYKFPKAVRGDHSVNLAATVTNRDGIVSGTAAPRVGFFFDQGGQFVVIGERVHAVDDLVLHGRLSGSDANILGYIAKYLRKAVEA